MFRLIKLAAYGLLGYVIYEMVMGMNDAVAEQPNRRSSGENRSSAPANTGRRKVSVQDSGGAERTERVGRGVVTH